MDNANLKALNLHFVDEFPGRTRENGKTKQILLYVLEQSKEVGGKACDVTDLVNIETGTLWNHIRGLKKAGHPIRMATRGNRQFVAFDPEYTSPVA